MQPKACIGWWMTPMKNACVRSFFFSSRRRHTRCYRDWSSDVCSSDLPLAPRRVCTRGGAPAAKVQRADAQVEQRDHHGGGARREERVGPGGQGPRELCHIVTEVAVQHGVRDPEAGWPRRERGLEPPIAGAEREYQAERHAG